MNIILVIKIADPTWQDTHFGTTNPKRGLVRGLISPNTPYPH